MIYIINRHIEKVLRDLSEALQINPESIRSMFSKLYDLLINIGDICLCKKEDKHELNCYQDETAFDYHGINNALCGKDFEHEYFIPKKILVIQMK